MGWWPFGKREESPPPDFSAVDSVVKAARMCREGKLLKVHLVPPAVGGADVPANTLFVPEPAARAKLEVDQQVLELARSRPGSGFDSDVEYKGKSAVPSRIHVRVFGPWGEFKKTIAVW